MAAGAKKDGASGASTATTMAANNAASSANNHVAGSSAPAPGSPAGSSGAGSAAAQASPASSPSSSAGGNNGAAPSAVNVSSNSGTSSNSSSAAHEFLTASANDYFTPGSVVRCKTCSNKNIEGEVMAFDPATKMLILKMSATNKRSDRNDVRFLNLNMVSDVTIVREEKGSPSSAGGRAPPNLNTERLKTRISTNIERKKLNAKAFKAGVSPEGQKLFQVISKTLDQIDWQGENICVMGKVYITPPYRPENVKGVADSKAAVHVRKIIEKHLQDQRRMSAEAGASPVATVVASAASSSSTSSAATPTSPLPSSSSSSATPTAASSAAATNSGSSSPATNSNGPRPHRGVTQQQGGESGRGRQRNSPASRGGGGGGGGGGGSNSSSPKPVYFMQ